MGITLSVEQQKEEWKKLIEYCYYNDSKMNIDAETFAKKFQQLMEHPDKSDFIDWKDDEFAGGFTMLICSMFSRKWDICKLLVEHGADVNICEMTGSTVLIEASSMGRTGLVKLILEKGADINVANMFGDTAVMYAVKRGHNDIVSLLIENGADIRIADCYGKTLLMLACTSSSERTDTVKILLEKGRDADLNIAEEIEGKTALMWASCNGHKNVVKLLLESGADQTIVDKEYGWTALLHACASCEDCVETVKLLLENVGADLNIADKDGKTALMWALKRQRPHTAKLLLDKGADINIADKDGMTSVMWACKHGYNDTVKLFLENGADPTTADKNGRTALHFACEKSQANIGHGKRTLRLACDERNDEKVVQLLLSRGANVNAKDNAIETPLQIACKRNQTEIVWLMVRQNCWMSQ